MKKDVVKTCVLVCAILALMLVIFLVVGNIKYGVENFSRNSLIKNDPTVTILFNRFDGNTMFRKASVESNELTSKEKIEYILENLTDGDYETKNIKPQKNTCNIDANISFKSINGKCNIM
ncbi:MAG: hypothetical protein K2H20_03355, partial [Bacilli bacterium]|nr:hypothetical protein [Bacilli bacterium]